MKFKMNLCDGPYNAIVDGYKTIEMRVNRPDRRLIKTGDTIEFTNNSSGEIIECLVLNKFEYKNFEELYKHHDKISIGYSENEIPNPEDMLIYYKKEEIEQFGVVGIEIKLLK